MICYIFVAIFAQMAGATVPTSIEDMIAIGIWVLCDIELLKLLFRGR